MICCDQRIFEDAMIVSCNIFISSRNFIKNWINLIITNSFWKFVSTTLKILQITYSNLLYFDTWMILFLSFSFNTLLKVLLICLIIIWLHYLLPDLGQSPATLKLHHHVTECMYSITIYLLFFIYLWWHIGVIWFLILKLRKFVAGEVTINLLSKYFYHIFVIRLLHCFCTNFVTGLTSCSTSTPSWRYFEAKYTSSQSCL